MNMPALVGLLSKMERAEVLEELLRKATPKDAMFMLTCVYKPEQLAAMWRDEIGADPVFCPFCGQFQFVVDDDKCAVHARATEGAPASEEGR